MKTFRGGVHPEEKKELSKDKKIEKLPLPLEVIIPLSQHTGKPAKPVVKVGDKVKTGEKIGELQGFISANVHSSITGEVKKIENRTSPLGGEVLSVVIEGNGSDEWSLLPVFPDLEKISPQQIVTQVKEAGIVGLGGAAFPTYVKLSPPKDKPIDIVILNGAECEPYLTTDYRLMLEHPEEILWGGKLILKALRATEGYIGIEDNKPSAIKVFEKLAPKFGFKLCVLKTKYPQGGERQLINAITGREVPCGGLPFDVGTYVQNVGTAVAIYEACKEGKPLVEKVVCVTGGVREPKNLKVRIGTPFKKVIEYCGGYDGGMKKLIMGGPMMGVAQFSEDVPIIKGVSGVLVQKELSLPKDEPCIRCGMCIDACSIGLLPLELGNYIEHNMWEEVKTLGVFDCIECGSCAWVCPAKRNLVHLIKYGKVKVQKLSK